MHKPMNHCYRHCMHKYGEPLLQAPHAYFFNFRPTKKTAPKKILTRSCRREALFGEDAQQVQRPTGEDAQ